MLHRTRASAEPATFQRSPAECSAQTYRLRSCDFALHCSVRDQLHGPTLTRQTSDQRRRATVATDSDLLIRQIQRSLELHSLQRSRIDRPGPCVHLRYVNPPESLRSYKQRSACPYTAVKFGPPFTSSTCAPPAHSNGPQVARRPVADHGARIPAVCRQARPSFSHGAPPSPHAHFLIRW